MKLSELMYAIDHGMIDEERIQAQILMSKREELLRKHPYKMWEGKDGKWYTYILDDLTGKRVLKKRTNQTALEDLIIGLIKQAEDDPTIEDIFTEWNDWRLECGKIAASSHKRYRNIFNKYYESFGQRRIRRLNPEELVYFLEKQLAKYHMPAKEFSNLKTITKGVMKRAKRRKLILWNVEEVYFDLDVGERDFKRKLKDPAKEVFDDGEWAVVTSYLRGSDNNLDLGLMVLFVTGMRVGELAALKPEDVSTDGTIFVRRTETCYKNDHGKYSYCVRDFPKTEAGARMIVLPEDYSWLIYRLRTLNPFGEYVFERDGERIKEQAFRRRLTRVCEKLGIEPKSPHKIRKTYGTILLDNGVDQRFVLDQMGHTSITTTEIHYHRSRRSIDKKRDILNSLPEFKKGNQRMDE